MSKIHLVIPDCHAHYQHDNDRAIWLGHLIRDIKPDVVINLGDLADMPSLSSYDKGKKGFQGRTYIQDINAALDFQDKLWSTVKAAKKRLPLRVTLIGNHEHRIERAIEVQPELDGAISYNDLRLQDFYDEVVWYNGSTPGSITVDGILYAHYVVGGVLGKPLQSEHHAYTLLKKMHMSCTVGHTHTLDYCIATKADGAKIMGLVAGCFYDYEQPYAGDAAKFYDRGVVIKRNVDNGCYDLEWISIDRLRKEYGN